MIPVTKTYLPNINKYKKYIDKIYKTGWITNNGPLVKELELRLKEHLGVRNIILVANGSLALLIAYKALGLKGEVITTPYSFVATSSTLLWGGLKPIFADINPNSLNIEPKNIENLVNNKTSAILPVHAFGNSCDIDTIENIASRYNLKVIYDAAPAFGVQYKNKSILCYGDISILSLHATKIFHTIEGGAIITNNDDLANRIKLIINFGISGPEKIDCLGINAKMNEFEAAMGLCVLDDIEPISKKRKIIWEKYRASLQNKVIFQQQNKHATQNFNYMPIIFNDEETLIKVTSSLNAGNIFPRRNYYPTLDTLNFINSRERCSFAQNIAKRVLCLPIYAELNPDIICNEIIKTLNT